MSEAQKTPQKAEQAQPVGMTERRKNAFLRYMAVLFVAAFILVVISLVIQMNTSKETISQLNETSTSAMSKAEELQEQNRSLQDENDTLQAQIEELQRQVEDAETMEKDLQSTIDELQLAQDSSEADLEHTQQAYEALMTAKACVQHDGNVTYSKAMETVRLNKSYLSEQALKEYQALLDQDAE